MKSIMFCLTLSFVGAQAGCRGKGSSSDIRQRSVAAVATAPTRICQGDFGKPFDLPQAAGFNVDSSMVITERTAFLFAHVIGLEEGDRIVALNGCPVADKNALMRVAGNIRNDEEEPHYAWVFSVERSGQGVVAISHDVEAFPQCGLYPFDDCGVF